MIARIIRTLTGAFCLRGLCAAAALHCLFCAKDKTVAGGYDDVENPALQLSLRDEAGKPAIGQVQVYARYQNPIEDKVPVLTRDLSGQTQAGIRDTTLLAAMERANLRGTPWPNRDTVEFNLIAVDTGRESYLGGFLLVKDPNGTFGFRRRLADGIAYPDGKGSLKAAPVLAAPVLNLRGRIGAKGLGLGLKSIFIPGSPYRAAVETDGSFNLPRLAGGRYEVKASSQDGKIWSAADSLDTGAEYTASEWSEADLIWVE
ncbi:MAG: hypothetical protein M3Y08_01085 [Fibrobacterota bacterium]|nr:hypothetical protein [Fibrobacterota bacterium]